MSPITLTDAQPVEELTTTNEHLQSLLQEKDKEIVKLRSQLAQAGKLATLGLQGAGIAHELNNPLTVISAEADEILDALDEGRLDPKQTLNSTTNIKNFAERMRVLVDHIRQYSREDKHANWTAIDINDPINDSLLLLRRQIENNGIRVKVSLTENLPKIWGQYNKLESVFQNLIANARDAFESIMDERTKELTIVSERHDNKIVVKIKDNGCGMTPEIIRRIYSPFFTTKTRENGTGIGLSITHNIVKEHHGEILVNSNPEKGTAFTLKFPLERRNRMDEENTK